MINYKKIMIKKILIICSILIITSHVNAAGSCLIKDWPSDLLSKYLENNKIVILNITNEISSSNIKSDTKIKDNIIWIFNEIINIEWYVSYFNYYLIFPISNDITKEVKRDYKLLEKEWEWLNKYLKIISKKWYNIQIKNACKWINEENCNLEWNALKIIWELIQNQSYIIDIYRKAVMWNKNINNNNLILVDNVNNKFINDIITNYWNWDNCVDSEEGFFAKISTAIKEIWNYNNKYKDWIKEWTDAIDLLNWSTSTDELEKELLTAELARQWIWWKRADAILWNLEKYNKNWWYSKENNFISNTYRYLWEVIKEEVAKFNINVIDKFNNMWGDEKTKTITSILSDWEKVKVNMNIANSVSQIYNSELPYMELWDKNSILIRTDIINMHNNLNNWINTLKKTCEISVKICNDQDSWNWLCWSCN